MCCVFAATAVVNDDRRPSSRWMMRSATSRMRLSCVTSSTVTPCFLARSCMRVTTSRPDCLSSEAVGSSARMMRGRAASARAMATRCFWPPESWLGNGPGARPGRPPRASRRRAAGSRCATARGAGGAPSARSALRSAREQVVRLEDVADRVCAPGRRRARQPRELLAEHPHAALLHVPQRADRGSAGGLARARRPGDDDDLAGADLGRMSKRICFLSAPSPKEWLTWVT